MKRTLLLTASIGTLALFATPALADSPATGNDSSGIGSANNGSTSNYTYTAMATPATLAATVNGGEVYINTYGNGGNRSGSGGGTGGTGGTQTVTWDAEFDNGAFANFAGLNAMNVNTGFFASQNASVNVSATIGSLNLTR